ncbi:MAG: hypothetical protein HC827_17260 [Cyanobacteria bacterium RM1_2_2]|nr:hypothetical protein [Cyanobacteria bacterium RM1_2_2]
MANNLNPDLQLAGLTLLSGENSFLKDLSEEDEAMITGGDRSNSNSGRRPRRRRRRRRRNRSISRT